MLTSESDATWKTHINAVINKASGTLGLLRQTLKNSAKLEKEQAFNSLVRLVLEYACSVLDPHMKNIKSLESAHQRAAH